MEFSILQEIEELRSYSETVSMRGVDFPAACDIE